MPTDPLLPTFSGRIESSGCQNPDCEANGRYLRIVSKQEMERMFPQLSEMSFSPLPPQATHVCDRCGFVYSGIERNGVEGSDTDDTTTKHDIDIEQYNWNPEMAYEEPVYRSALALVNGAPESASRSEVVEAVAQYIPGLGKEDVSSILDESSRDWGEPEIDLSEYM